MYSIVAIRVISAIRGRKTEVSEWSSRHKKTLIVVNGLLCRKKVVFLQRHSPEAMTGKDDVSL